MIASPIHSLFAKLYDIVIKGKLELAVIVVTLS